MLWAAALGPEGLGTQNVALHGWQVLLARTPLGRHCAHPACTRLSLGVESAGSGSAICPLWVPGECFLEERSAATGEMLLAHGPAALFSLHAVWPEGQTDQGKSILAFLVLSNDLEQNCKASRSHLERTGFNQYSAENTGSLGLHLLGQRLWMWYEAAALPSSRQVGSASLVSLVKFKVPRCGPTGGGLMLRLPRSPEVLGPSLPSVQRQRQRVRLHFGFPMIPFSQ